jgi:hypothetical protein
LLFSLTTMPKSFSALCSSLRVRLAGPLLALATSLTLSLSLALPAAAQAPAGAPLMNPPLKAAGAPAAQPGAQRTIGWEELVPADWDPMKDFKDVDFGLLQDGDPRANEMMKKLREVWDRAPSNPALVGQTVRIPGFVVPLEDSKEGMKEFLLVPYFGACIHSPPPPANQIIFVKPKTPAKGLRSMDTVWISGVLATERTDSYMGASSYRIDAQTVLPYEEQRGGK